MAFLDAKSAFDVVDHNQLMRKLYHLGVDGPLWQLLDSLHSNAQSSVKWKGKLSEPFTVKQGVRQGGVLSTDLYKLYVNQLLQSYMQSRLGARIGSVLCPSPTCADDVALLCDSSIELQTMINIATDYSQRHRYRLQPAKSVVIECCTTKRNRAETSDWTYTMSTQEMPVVQETIHLGVQRAATQTQTVNRTVEENIKKARRALYSLLSAGLHGRNGLDPITTVQLLKIYIIPVLTYSLEVLIPGDKPLRQLDQFLKKTVKQVFTLPTNTADPAVFILSGLLPMEALLHRNTLIFYCNICALPSTSTERQLAERHLEVNSTGWFSTVDRILCKYNLPEAKDILGMDIKELKLLKTKVKKAVNLYWTKEIVNQTQLYPSLRNMNCKLYWPGQCHPLLQSPSYSQYDMQRIPTKMRLTVGTYILQTNRASFNQNRVDPTCQLCKGAEETVHHFLISCPTLEPTREQIMIVISDIIESVSGITLAMFEVSAQTRILLDCTFLYSLPSVSASFDVTKLEFHIRRLCYALHTRRLAILEVQPRRKR